ncbi:hypothetical protein [Spiroplasma sp. SV19]|uniref:hypothetical protein n=1 Tax=Spiroplasma sp. SV19 TaxID=2570468 RepID=UPI0024B825C9|nr:hypothetical protein [Spiroplasma sp. SV19]WHQ37069.1 hypothetical protein E7Y35_04125 [Spiroplasma sp. SV19]
MKKVLSIISTLGLMVIGTASLTACNDNLSRPKSISPNPDPPPITHDIKYYQNLYDATLVDYKITKQDIDDLQSKEMIEQICDGGVLICAELQEMIDVAKVELYQYNVILSDCQYQILSLQYNGNFSDPTIKVKALGFLTDKLTTLSTIKAIMLLYPTNYTQNDINKISAQISTVQDLIKNLSA